MKNQKILIIADAAGSGEHYHVGDDAMAEVAINRLAGIAGKDNLVLACPHPRTAAKAYGVKAIWLPMHSMKTWMMLILFKPIPTWFQIVRLLWHLSQSKLVFKSGGGNINGKSTKFPILSLARKWNKPIIVVSQTIGPLGPKHRPVLQRQLENALWIGVRDQSFSQQQSGQSVHFTIDDAAFLQPQHNTVTRDIVNSHANIIGIAYSKLKNCTPDQFNTLIGITRKITAELTCIPVLVPHHGPHGRGDLKIIAAIRSQWPDPNMIALNKIQPARAILALTGGMRLLLATRYHAVIFGLTMGIPTVGIYSNEYTEAKLRGAYEQFQMEPAIISITEVETGLIPLVKKVLSASSGLKDVAERILEERLNENLAPYQLIKDLLDT